MTQDTNNQEWWEKEFEAQGIFPIGIWHDSLSGYFDRKEYIKNFIRKVSQQSREDALKECLAKLQEHASHTMEVTYGDGTTARIGEGNMHIKDVEKMFEREFKLPPKQ